MNKPFILKSWFKRWGLIFSKKGLKLWRRKGPEKMSGCLISRMIEIWSGTYLRSRELLKRVKGLLFMIRWLLQGRGCRMIGGIWGLKIRRRWMKSWLNWRAWSSIWILFRVRAWTMKLLQGLHPQDRAYHRSQSGPPLQRSTHHQPENRILEWQHQSQ